MLNLELGELELGPGQGQDTLPLGKAKRWDGSKRFVPSWRGKKQNGQKQQLGQGSGSRG